MWIHYRRLLFSIILIFLQEFVSFQIILFVLMSELSIIMILGFRPFKSKAYNISEGINETFILLILYHMICLSDFVPSYQRELREQIGFSNIGTTTFVALFFIL